MFSIQKTGEGYYLATLKTSHEKLSRIDCVQLKHELLQVIKPHREISVNLKGVNSIDKQGYKILRDLVHHANLKKCKLKFIHVGPVISTSISKLLETKIQLHDELENY